MNQSATGDVTRTKSWAHKVEGGWEPCNKGAGHVNLPCAKIPTQQLRQTSWIFRRTVQCLGTKCSMVLCGYV